MSTDVKRVLFVNSEMSPYLPDGDMATYCRTLAQGVQENKVEIRSFVPRYGVINERKNQLHEVIRLSGMNIVIDDVDRPLIIKVASLPSARMQVYFIDNEDYFHRKALYTDASGKFFKDNGQRAIFFARGVLETVKKLRWSPDIVHCSGWMSHVLPFYLKTAYKDDPIFTSSKVVLSLFNDIPTAKFEDTIAHAMLFKGEGECQAAKECLGDNPAGIDLAKLAVCYSDGIVEASKDLPEELLKLAKDQGKPVLPYAKSQLGKGYAEYMKFYSSVK